MSAVSNAWETKICDETRVNENNATTSQNAKQKI